MLDLIQGDLTPWLIGAVVVVALVAIVIITLLQRQQQNNNADKAAAQAAELAAQDERDAATQAKAAAQRAATATMEAESAAKVAEEAAGRMPEQIGDRGVARRVETYQHLSPEELQYVADQFIGQFKGMTNDPQAQQFAQMDPATVTPEVAAQMHDYAKDHHPSILHVLDHPVITAAAVGVGLFGLKLLLDQQRAQRIEDSEDSEDAVERPRVHFSAFYPRIVPVKTSRTLVVYVHMLEELPNIRIKALKFQDEMGTVQPEETTTAAARPVSKGSYLTIMPDCNGIEFNPPFMRLKWGGKEERAVFSFEADERLVGSAVNGEIDIYVEMVNVATLKMALLCDASDKDVPNDQQETVAPSYDRIFASYSHADTAIVEACRRAYVALGMKVLIDTEDLRSGELFTPALMKLIEDANVFQLFWSERAAQSAFVRQEWMHAVDLNRPAGYIRPVRWERPLAPAPAELDSLQIHFKYIPLPSVDEDDAPPTRTRERSEESAT